MAMAMMNTKLTMAILFFFRRRRPSFQKLTLSRMTTRLCFSSLLAGRKSSAFSCMLSGFFLIFSMKIAPLSYCSLMRGSMILYRISTITFAMMTMLDSRMVVPMIMV